MTPRLELLENRIVFALSATPLPFTPAGTAHVAADLIAPNDFQLYQIQLQAGDVVTAAVRSPPSGGALQSNLRIFDAAGRPMALDAQQGGDARLTFQAPRSGNYLIGVSSAGDDAYDPSVAISGKGGATTGLYTLDLQRQTAVFLPDLAGASFRLQTDTAAYGDTVEGSFAVDNRGGSVPPDTDVQVLLSSDNLFGLSSLVLATFALPSVGPGKEFTSGVFAMQLPDLAQATAAGLPASGPVYVGLRIDPAGVVPELNPHDQSGVHAGEDWQSLTVVTPVTANGSNLSGASAQVLGDPNSRISGELAAGQTDWYQLTVPANGNVRLTATVTASSGSTLEPRLTLSGPVTSDDPNGPLLIQSDSSLVQQLPAGTYMLTVSSRSGAGGYQLTLETVQTNPALQPIPVTTSGFPPTVGGIAVADLTGDGKPDIITANLNYNPSSDPSNYGNNSYGGVSVLLGNGDGTFAPPQTFNGGFNPSSVVVADVNGDGKPDLVVINTGKYNYNTQRFYNGNISVLLGNGDGTFGSPQTFDAGYNPQAIVAADITGDGKSDLIVDNRGKFNSTTGTTDGAGIAVLMGQGDGTFGPPQLLVSGTFAGMAVADVNGDGKPDLIVDYPGTYNSTTYNFDNAGVSVLLGNGNATFQNPQFIPIKNAELGQLTVADLTGDGNPDLIVVNQSTYDPTTSDFSQGVIVLPGNGDGTFQNPKSSTITGGFIDSMTVADVNGDGKGDLVASNGYGGQVGVMLGNGDGTFQDPQISQALTSGGIYSRWGTSLAVADLNGDGKPDIVAGNGYSGQAAVLLGNGDGAFQPAQPSNSLSTGTQFPSVKVADVTGNGKPDLIVSGMFYGSVSLLLGNDDGTFQTPKTLAGVSSPATVADFNGDGKPDLIDGRGQVFLGNGDGTFHLLPKRLGKYGYIDVLATVDIRGDGKPDLITEYYDYKDHSTTLDVLLNSGGGTFRPPKQIASFQNAGYGQLNVTEADLNGDGKPDLIVSYDDNSDHSATISVLLNSGDGTFQTANKIATFQNSYGYGGPKIIQADLSGDGKPPDLLVSYNDKDSSKNYNYSKHESIKVLLNNGDGTFQAPQLITSGYTALLGVADLNGDGNPPDLVTTYMGAYHSYTGNTYYSTSGVSVLPGNGDGTFQPAGPPVSVEFSGNDAHVINVKGDGAPELVLGNASSYSYSKGFSSGIAVLAGDGKGSFQPAQIINGYSNVVTVADLTGDGRPDIITEGYGGGLRVLLSNTDGSFTPAPSSTAGSQRNIPYTADLTGDGVEDSVVLNSAGAILFRKGLPGTDNSFAPPVTLNGRPDSDTPSRPARDLTVLHTATGMAVATADLKPVSTSAGTGQSNEYTVSNYRVAEDGTVHRTTAFTTTSQPTRIVAADLTGNGRDDIIVADAADDSIQIAFQKPDGAFSAPITLTTGEAPSDITVADFNGDGLPDIAVSDQNSGDVTVFLNDPKHQFAQSYVYRAGTGLFGLDTTGTTPVVNSLEQTVSLAAGDFTGNGSNDLVVVNSGTDSLSVLANDGQDGFADPQPALTFSTSDGTETSTQAGQVVVGHFHGPDQPTDLAVLMQDLGQVWIYTGNGDGTFTHTFSIAAGSQPTGMNVVLDPQTGFEDLLIGDSFGDVLRLQGKGDGTFQVAGRRTSLSVQDLSNGRTDVLVANQQSDRITVQAPQPGSSQITPVATLDDGTQSTLAPGDVQWAKLDKNSPFYNAIVVASGGNEILVYRGTGFDSSGNPTFTAPVSYSVGTNPVSVTVQDINGDHIPDLIVANQGSNDVSILFGSWDDKGDWVGSSGPRLKSGGSGPIAAQAVFPADGGRPQLIVTNGQSGTLAELSGEGNGFFNDKHPQIVNLPDNPVLTQGPSFFGSTNSGVLLTATGQLIGVNFDDLSDSIQTEFTPPQGEQIVADQALANGQVVAVLSSGTVEDLEPAESGGLTAFSTFVPLTGIPSEPSALAVLQEESGMQVLVSAAGGDQVFAFSVPGSPETELPPQTPTGPVVDVTPLTGGPLLVVATLTADVGLPTSTTTLVGNLAAVEAAEAAEGELLNLGLTAQGAGSPAFALGLLTHLLTVDSTEDAEGEEVVVQGLGPAVLAVPPRPIPDGLDLENLLRDLDLYQPPPNPERPSSISRRPAEKPKQELIARPWALDLSTLRMDPAVPAAGGAPATRAAVCDAVLVQSPSSWGLETWQLYGLAGLTLWPWPGHGFGCNGEPQPKQQRQRAGEKPGSSSRGPKRR